MEFLRLFTAVVPERALQNRLSGDFSAALAGRSDMVRPVKPENLHCTLHFLGNTPDALVSTVATAVQAGIRAIPAAPFTVIVGDFGAFPSARRARVIWRSIGDADGKLGVLQAAITEAIREAGIEFDTRPFRAHLTVAYLKRMSQNRSVQGLLDSLNAAKQGAELRFAVDRVHLIQSKTAPGGALHTSLHSFSLDDKPRISSGERAPE